MPTQGTASAPAAPTPEAEIPGTLEQLAQHNEAMRAQATGQPLPQGTAPVVEPAPAPAPEPEPPKDPAVAEPAPVAEPAEVEEPPAVAAAAVPAAKIRIGAEEFNSVTDAVKYAEKLQEEKLVSDAYSQGMQDTLQQQPAVGQTPAAAPAEDNFEEEFYGDPKKYLTKVKVEAKEEALEVIRQEQKRENLWTDFFAKNPDLDGQKLICQSVLDANWNILGHMKDTDKAMKILANKTREYFQNYNERGKPQQELPNTAGGPTGAGGVQTGVTPVKKDEAPLDFISQINSLKRG